MNEEFDNHITFEQCDEQKNNHIDNLAGINAYTSKTMTTYPVETSRSIVRAIANTSIRKNLKDAFSCIHETIDIYTAMLLEYPLLE